MAILLNSRPVITQQGINRVINLFEPKDKATNVPTVIPKLKRREPLASSQIARIAATCTNAMDKKLKEGYGVQLTPVDKRTLLLDFEMSAWVALMYCDKARDVEFEKHAEEMMGGNCDISGEF